jgi:hypothetical protein
MNELPNWPEPIEKFDKDNYIDRKLNYWESRCRLACAALADPVISADKALQVIGPLPPEAKV